MNSIKCLVFLLAVAAAQRIKVDIYGESLCPFTTRFMTNQVAPVMRDMADYIDINIIAFGIANCQWNGYKNDYECTCQHGEAECRGNILQTCIQRYQPTQSLAFPVINCVQGQKTIAGQESCLNYHRQTSYLPNQKIVTCSRGYEGRALLNNNGHLGRRLAGGFSMVPHIRINGQTHPQWDSQSNLRMLICQRLQMPKPTACMGY